jgi:hypothetical protein
MFKIVTQGYNILEQNTLLYTQLIVLIHNVKPKNNKFTTTNANFLFIIVLTDVSYERYNINSLFLRKCGY